MLIRYRRSLLVASGAAIAMFAIATPAMRVAAGPASACTANSGVTVIVDFSAFHGNIERGCGAAHPDNALDALQAAGFRTAGTANYGDAFVCRIDALPPPKREACVTTPPGNASWSFYFAKPTDPGWTYSAAGVTSFHPAPGMLLAFAFGNHAKPSLLPADVAAPPPTTPHPTAPATVPTTGPPVTPAVGPPTTVTTIGAPGSTVAAATRPPTTATTTTSPAPRSSVAPTSSSAPLRIVNRRAAPNIPGGGSGSPVPVVLTVALVAVLGAGALLVVRARGRDSA